MDLPTADQIAGFTADELDQLLGALRSVGSQIKAVEVCALREVDRRQIPLGDGMRTLEDWIVGRMDVRPDTARRLATVARTDSADLDGLLADGVSFDRVAELAHSGETDPHLELDLPALRSMLARRTPIERDDEQAAFDDRFLAIQPTLDETSWKLWGQLPALEGKIVADTLDRVADELPDPPAGHRQARATRRADSLFVVCDRHGENGTNGSAAPGVPATMIVDATDGPVRPGAWIVSGPRVGPATLERILCGSPVDVIARTEDGEPLRIGTASTAIPPAARRYVLWRDGGMCTADGCSSAYRLQPHHIQERVEGGNHHHTNLASLCWFHHHVVIHGRGFRIDPDSPARRRRFLTPTHSPPGSYQATRSDGDPPG